MARVHNVMRARSAPGRCEKCGKEIKPGDGYKWAQPRPYPGARGIRRVRCATCPAWQHWELSSSRMADVYRAQAEFDDSISGAQSVDDVQSALDELVGVINETADGYEESAQNIEEGFQHATYQSEELQEKADTLRDWAGTLESIDVPDPDDEDFAVDCDACEGTGRIMDEDKDEGHDCTVCDGTGHGPDEHDTDAWLAAVVDACSEAQDCPV